MSEYSIVIPGLAERVAACPLVAKDKALIALLGSVPLLSGAKVVTSRGRDGDHYFKRRKVFTADGQLVHTDHEAWLSEQLQADNGNAAATYTRLRAQGLLLSKCQISTLYIVSDRGQENQADFFQVEVEIHEERMDCEALESYCYSAPRHLSDLMGMAVGDPLPEDKRASVTPPVYLLRRITDVAQFVQMAEHLESEKRKRDSGKVLTVTDGQGVARNLTYAQLNPGLNRFPCKTRRLFNDWARSSAGLSGARICDHWVMDFNDWTDPSDESRTLYVTPKWTFEKPLAEIHANRDDDYDFNAKLMKLDKRVKVPFGWFFFMLHDNRVHDGAGHRVIRAAEAGVIGLQEFDYQVLRAWSQQPYSF